MMNIQAADFYKKIESRLYDLIKIGNENQSWRAKGDNPLLEFVRHYSESEEEYAEFLKFQEELNSELFFRGGFISKFVDEKRAEAQRLYDQTDKAYNAKPTKVLRNIFKVQFEGGANVFEDLSCLMFENRDEVIQTKGFDSHINIKSPATLVKKLIKSNSKGMEYDSKRTTPNKLVFSNLMSGEYFSCLSLDLVRLKLAKKVNQLDSPLKNSLSTFEALYQYSIFRRDGENEVLLASASLTNLFLMDFISLPSFHSICRDYKDLDYVTTLNLELASCFDQILNKLNSEI